ncbi:mRNA capping enzyme-domain-containing protein [Mycena floridula]|nr:mRNA capping enzyme-domain-containing protein [Mycena floridula]
MPFDPVRDAVLNSPVVQSYSLSTRAEAPATNSGVPSPLTSPSMSRRATDLSVLLNSDSSQSSRSPAISNLVQQEEKLTASQPLRKRTIDDDDIQEIPHQHWFNNGHQTFSSPSTSNRGLPASPSVNSRPSSSSSTTVSPVMRPPALAYNPKKRKTPAGSVLVPLSEAEMETYKNYVGKGAQRLTKRKRARSTELDDDRPRKKLAGDVGVVVDYYNGRAEVGVVQRLHSPIIGLKNFNNWVKSVLISRFAYPAVAQGVAGYGGRKGKVLDMGCGKGGDISKWVKARIKELIAADIAAVSVDQAQNRWETLRGPKFEASFAAIDCYTEPLSKAFPPERLETPFDAVSLQFCMHYAFETEAKARCMLSNVTSWLRPGGIFIGTIPNAEQLLENLDAVADDSDDLSFGNAVYQIRFEDRKNRPIYGHRYWFFLQDAVEDVPEYIVQWDNFVQLAAEYDLHVVYKEEFHQVFEEHQTHPDFGPLMVKMKVVDANGESSMDEDQWEAANIYIAFALEKR